MVYEVVSKLRLNNINRLKFIFNFNLLISLSHNQRRNKLAGVAAACLFTKSLI